MTQKLVWLCESEDKTEDSNSYNQKLERHYCNIWEQDDAFSFTCETCDDTENKTDMIEICQLAMAHCGIQLACLISAPGYTPEKSVAQKESDAKKLIQQRLDAVKNGDKPCLLYTSPSPRDS